MNGTMRRPMLRQSRLRALSSRVGTPASQMRSESYHTRETFDLRPHEHLRRLFRQVKRGLRNGASGLDAFKLFLGLVISHFDHGDRNAAIAKLHSFGAATKTLFADYSRAFRLLMASATDSVEAVRDGVSEQYPSLMPV